MALATELLRVLEDTEEPLPKRLKIADNAFKSVDLPIQHREAILLKWLGKTTKTNDKEVWNLLLNWLKSQQLQDVSRNEISQEHIRDLMNVITKRIKYQEGIDIIHTLDCAVALIENTNFQLCFKYNLEEYCKFIANILNKIPDADNLCKFITNEQLFNRNIISNDEFYKHFMENTLGSLACTIERFYDNKVIFQNVSKIVEKCLFHRNYKNFSIYFKMYFEENSDSEQKIPILPKLLLKNLKVFYVDDEFDPKYLYKLIFHSYCLSYGNNFEMIHKFLIILTEILGFDAATYFQLNKLRKLQNASSSLDKSIRILTELCQVLTEQTNELNSKVNDKTFTEFLQDLSISLINLTSKPDKSCYEFLSFTVILDPLIVEKTLSNTLVYIMLSDKTLVIKEYEKFLTAIFEVFAKLHRIPNLISKMIPTIKNALEGTVTSTATVLQFDGTHECISKGAESTVFGNMLPESVLEYFTECITTLASWQVMNVFKTFFFHLDVAVKNDLTTSNSSTEVYIELISTLLCQFLSSVRIAEHTVTTAVVEKFVDTMNDLKRVLEKFGTALVNMEHNPVLMRAYLNICYAWGDMYITLVYYSINNEVTLQRTLDSDTSACNITYLHSYLTRDQWCLISQRITNFGEKPCKQIMQRLFIQKLKAMLLFEDNVSEEVISSIRTSISSTVEDNWKEIIFDPLVLDQIIMKSNNLTHVSELILQDVIDMNNLTQLKLLFDCKELIGSMLYTCVSKINKIFKQKHKHKQVAIRVPLCSRIFPYVTENLFINKESNEELQQVINMFVKELAQETNRSELERDSTINEKDLGNYLNIIETIPVVQCNFSNAHEVLFMYLICVLLDMRCYNLHNMELINKCESIIIGLNQNYTGSLKTIINPFSLTRTIIDNFTRYLEMFKFISQNIFKNEDNFGLLRNGINFLTKNLHQDKYLQCSIIILQNISKHKKSKFSTENKNLLLTYQDEIYKSILELLKTEQNPNLIEAYSLALKYYLTKDWDEFIELLPFLDYYIDDAVKNTTGVRNKTKGIVLLFTIILRNKSKFKNLQEDIVLKAWTCCQHLRPDTKEYEDYAKLIILIFEHIPNEQFSTISTDLLKLMSDAIKEDPVQFTQQLKIWNAILGCDFNPVKVEMWQKILSSLLLDIIIVHLKDDKENRYECIYKDVVKFEVNILQNLHLLLKAPVVEAILITVSVITSNTSGNFTLNFTLCISLMETLLKYRNSLTMDYLPSYLQRYRALLVKLCVKSDSYLKLEANDIQQIADCAHKLEKLTNMLVACNKPIARISPYLIADILKQYEEITLYPAVKTHLNNCLYSLITLCDQHAISYLMRILTTASTEMFKVIYENYRKYYKYTGKV